MQKFFFDQRIAGSTWLRLVCIILAITGAVLFLAHEEAKSLFRSDCNILRAFIDRWVEAGRPAGDDLKVFMEKRPEFILSAQTFLIGTQSIQAQFTLRNPKINWKGGQLFVTTNKVLVLHIDKKDQIVHWIKIIPCFDLVDLRDKS